ncbi:hypothetical protein [Mucilaginibacter polytrichastri]|uniref:hypothetical protein n=1 Tax=Mucilaginibacter polytrichastri TaxID=1302689 RepID=UPI0008EAB729|nr:hypothetical protein [Mucilaginibacter polytrichastri]SFT08599.1 hypothetical protein SAMN04487890_11043 [Mucilaginibacter polytrichastri]
MKKWETLLVGFSCGVVFEIASEMLFKKHSDDNQYPLKNKTEKTVSHAVQGFRNNTEHLTNNLIDFSKTGLPIKSANLGHHLTFNLK